MSSNNSNNDKSLLKQSCTKCGANILKRTAKKTGGLCMPCYKKEKEEQDWGVKIDLHDEKALPFLIAALKKGSIHRKYYGEDYGSLRIGDVDLDDHRPFSYNAEDVEKDPIVNAFITIGEPCIEPLINLIRQWPPMFPLGQNSSSVEFALYILRKIGGEKAKSVFFEVLEKGHYLEALKVVSQFEENRTIQTLARCLRRSYQGYGDIEKIASLLASLGDRVTLNHLELREVLEALEEAKLYNENEQFKQMAEEHQDGGSIGTLTSRYSRNIEALEHALNVFKKPSCTKCGAKILQTTVEKTGGLCMHCYKKEKGLERKGCFIATACYESLDCPEVLCFRRFRDEKLSSSRLATHVIKLYYHFSPPLAKYLQYKPKLRRFVRKYFLNLIVRTIQFNNNFG